MNHYHDYRSDFHLQIKKRLLRLLFGWLFIIFGVAGLVLPVLQGILFVAIGILLLAPDVPLFKRILKKLKERYPKIARKANRIKPDIEE